MSSVIGDGEVSCHVSAKNPVLLPKKGEWSREALALDSFIENHQSALSEISYGGASSGLGGGRDETELFCAPEILLHTKFCYGDEEGPHHLPSVSLHVGAYRCIVIPLDEEHSYHGVRKFEGPSSDYIFSSYDMHMVDQLRSWRGNVQPFAPLFPNRPWNFYTDMKVEARFSYNLEIPDFDLFLAGLVEGIPECAEQFMHELCRTTLPLVEALDELKHHYRHIDAAGKRLWVDRGMQSATYYRHGENLARDIVMNVRSIARKYGMPCIGEKLFEWPSAEYGLYVPLAATPYVFAAGAQKLVGRLRHQLWRIQKKK